MDAWMWVALAGCLAIWARVLWVVMGVSRRVRRYSERRKVRGG